MGTHNQGNAQAGTPPLLGGRYQIVQQLGVGGFGKTFLAQDLHLPGDARCVVKQLQPDVSSQQELQIARRLFETEATVLARLGEHPQIPRLLAHFEENEEFYLAQELIEGRDLEDELALGSLWDESRAIAFLSDILNTLAFVHNHRVIHRDLKPANLIRRQHDQRIVLIDFGAVKQVSTQIGTSASGMGRTVSIGTQGYMPPEQVSGHPQFSSDVYAVGMIAIQGITGRYPNTFALHPQTGEVDWQGAVPHLQPALMELISKMVRYDYRDRYSNAASALAALGALPLHHSSNYGATHTFSQSSPQVHHPQTPPHEKAPAPATAHTVAVGTVPQRRQSDAPQPLLSQSAGAPMQSDSKKGNLMLPIVAGIGSVMVVALGIFGWQQLPEWRASTGGTTQEEPEDPSQTLYSGSAIDTVEDFYAAINRKDWETARSHFGADLSRQFKPKFFQQFEQVTIEDLRVVEQNADTLELVGQNTYVYPDSSIQQEERSFTLQLIDQRPKIVASEFIAITQRRN